MTKGFYDAFFCTFKLPIIPMKKILETERIYLREFELTDAEAMFQLNDDWDVIKYTGDPAFSSEEEALEFLQNYDDYKRNGMGRWAVITKNTNQFIGWCGLKRHDNGMVDIGFRFFKTQWGKGYATEAARATLEYGFKTLNTPEIIGRAARENQASLKVLNKLGMTFWKDDNCKGIDDSIYYRISNQYV